MKDVTIVVAGKSKTGKSSVANLIHDALKNRGAQVRLFDHVHDEYEALDEKPALEKTDEQLNVLIKVVTTTRNLDLVSPDQE